jgi:prepilin-type processing-associated H-X9-DG protein
MKRLALWLVWSVSLLAASVMTFGMWGVAIGFLIGVAYWAGRVNQPVVPEFCIFAAVIVAAPLVLLPSVRHNRSRERQSECAHHMQAIVAALFRHADETGSLPAATSQIERRGLAMSWREAILPRLDVSFSIATESHLGGVAEQRPSDVFACPEEFPLSRKDAHCAYFGVIGEHTAWPTDRGRRFDEITDPPSETILVLESNVPRVPWSKPRDLTFDEAVALLTNPAPTSLGHPYSSRDDHFFYLKSGQRGINVAFADGHVAFLRLPIDRNLAIALLTVNGREQIDHAYLRSRSQPELNYPRCYAFAAFVALALLPLVRVLRLRQPTPPLASPDA